MKKYIFLSTLLLSLLACQSNSKKYLDANAKEKQTSNDTLAKTGLINNKNDSTKSVKLEQKPSTDIASNILGVWIVSTSQTGNASFVLDKNTIYYPETDGRYKYKLFGDSIKVKYDDYTQSLSFKLKGKDTLLLKGDDENHTYYRVKK